jgi:hypothetical protein
MVGRRARHPNRGQTLGAAIVDTAGNRPLSLLRRAMTPHGTLALVGSGRHFMQDHPAGKVVVTLESVTLK